VQAFLDGQAPAPLRVAKPVVLRVAFVSSHMGDLASLLPGSERLDGRTIEFSAPDMPAAYRMFRAAVNLAAV
jgi:D-amino peptidase